MDDSKTAHKRGRKLKFSRILIVLLLIAVCLFVVFRLSVRSKFRARIEAIRAAGYPVTLAELNEWYTIPEDAENAANTLIDAFLCYYECNKTQRESLPIVGTGKLPARTEPLTEETKGLVAQYLADNQQALELLHKAAPIEHCRYHVDFSVGLEFLIPHIGDLRKCAMLLKLEAILHAENGNAVLAARSIRSIFGIAHSLAKEPLLISQLVCTGCKGIAISSLERVVNRVEFTDEQLVKLTETVSNAEDLSTISRALAGERCMGISFFKNPVVSTPELIGRDAPPVPILELYKALGLADRDAVIYLDIMNDYMETARLPLHHRQKAAETIEAKLKATSKVRILLHGFMGGVPRAITINIRSIAQLNTARIGIAVQRYRLANGDIPDTLTELVPTYLDAVPKDPFDGSELRYRKLESGFVVYSVGEDKKDDGGRERLPFGERKNASSTWDITFIVER
ncbi:MAG: hypothetical protein ACYS3N_08690 [Planctomycetota bacterium]